MAEPMTKDQLVAALTSTRDEMLTRLRAMPADAFEQGRYENGWNAREILAHVASIEWTYPKLLEVAQGAPPAPPQAAAGPAERTTEDERPGVASRTARGGILSYNDRQVEKRKDASPAELIDEFEQNRNALIAAVAAADNSLFAREIRSAGGVTGALADVINAVANFHVRMHVTDIAGDEWKGARM